MSDFVNDGKSGIKTVLAEEVRADDAVFVPVAAEQLALLPLRQVGADENDANEVSTAGRGPGRPVGAKNKSTEAMRNFLLSRYRSPLVALAEVYSRPVDQLAKDLGLELKLNFDQALELLKLQLQCAKELAPYVHQKQPMAIDGGGAGIMQLIINSGGATAAQVENAGVMKVNFIEPESQLNQGLSDEEKSNSVIVDSVDMTNDEQNQLVSIEKQSD